MGNKQAPSKFLRPWKREQEQSKRGKQDKNVPGASSIGDANKMPDELWAKLLAPLHLIDCIRLESTCGAFSRTIYAGQIRFEWNKKFQDYLYERYGMNRTYESLNLFLGQITPKIAPYCQQLVLKVYKLPSYVHNMVAQCTVLESIYLKVITMSNNMNVFFLDEKMLQKCGATLHEIRLCLIRGEFDWLPPGFAYFIERFNPSQPHCVARLDSLQVWKAEPQYDFLHIDTIRKMRIYYNNTLREFFRQFCLKFSTKLTHLHLKWETTVMNDQVLINFTNSITHLKQLQSLALEINWITFDASRMDQFYQIWLKCLQIWPMKQLSHLSLDIQHNNYRSPYTNGMMCSHLTLFTNLQVLRVVISRIDTFPLRIAAKVKTLELNFKYLKHYREIWTYIAATEHMPRYESSSRYFFDYFPEAKTVHTIRIVHGPWLDANMFDHLRHYFTNLEIFYYRGIHPRVYSFIMFVPDALLRFIRSLKNLRVIQFDDRFPKAALAKILLTEFIYLARNNPTKQYAIYCDIRRNLNVHDESMMRLLQSSKLFPNLKVF